MLFTFYLTENAVLALELAVLVLEGQCKDLKQSVKKATTN